MEKLNEKLKNKRDDFFLPSDIEALQVHIEESGEIIKAEFNETCTNFYNLCINYVTARLDYFKPTYTRIKYINMSNEDEINWSNVKPSIYFFKSNFKITLNEEELYEQFKMFEKLLEKQTDE